MTTMSRAPLPSISAREGLVFSNQPTAVTNSFFTVRISSATLG